MLKDLSIVDFLLRQTFLPMTIDVEHFAKINLLATLEEHDADGYQIVQEFLDSKTRINDKGERICPIADEISRGKRGAYTSALIGRYEDEGYPVWAFLELVPFGAFNSLWSFCANRFEDKSMKSTYYLLQDVKSLRNACGHNNCILNDLAAGAAVHQPSYGLVRGLRQAGISKEMLQTKLTNARLEHIIATLYLHHRFASKGICEHTATNLQRLLDRMYKHADYYEKNDQINTGFRFIKIMVRSWY